MTTNTRTTRRAFTLLEVLVTVSIIAVLLTIVIVSFGRVRDEAKRSICDRLLTNIQQAVDVFEKDTGYAPPLLVPDDPAYAFQTSMPSSRVQTIVPEAQADPQDALLRSRYLSEYSITAYLIGIGDLDGDAGTGINGVFPSTELDDGKDGDGIRNPGRDKSWGGAVNRANHMAETTGRVFGPYLDVASLGDDLRVDEFTGMYRIYDAYDSPIRYYRYWPKFVYNADSRVQSVVEIPYELLDFGNLAAHIEFGDSLSLTANRDLFASEYMLVSAGAEPLDYVRAPSGRPLEAFGDMAFDESSGQTTYIEPTDTAALSTFFSSPIAPLWTGTRPFLESNIKRGQR